MRGRTWPAGGDGYDGRMAFVLHHQVLPSPHATRTALVLHGALGSGQNFRGFIKKLGQSHPEYCFVLVDLRNHGQSHPAPPPHTLENAARDLKALIEANPELPPTTTLIGHSFGGKVAIEFVRSGPDDARAKLQQVWVLDANPGAQQANDEHEVLQVVTAVRNVPLPIPNRQHVIDSLRAQGMSQGLANWMTTNIEREGSEYRWAFDLDGIVALLKDYFGKDLWPFLATPRQSPEFHFVVAEKSDRWNGEMTERARQLGPETGCHVHVLENAGHWLHVDNPAGLLDILDAHLAK